MSYRPHCEGLDQYTLEPTALMSNEAFRTVWCFWYRNISSVFLPFLALVLLNFGIVMQYRVPLVREKSRHQKYDDRNLMRNRMDFLGGAGSSSSTAATELELVEVTKNWVNKGRSSVEKSARKTMIVIVVAVRDQVTLHRRFKCRLVGTERLVPADVIRGEINKFLA